MKRFGLMAGLVMATAVMLPAQVVSHPHTTPVTDKAERGIPPLAASAAQAKAPAAKAADAPVINELQQTQLDYFTLQLTMINMQANQVAAPWQAKRQALIAEMVKANPGYRWQEAQMPGQTSGLVKIQEKPVLAPPADKGVQGQPTAKPRDDAK